MVPPASGPPDIIRSIAAPVAREIDRIKGSRFLADLLPATDESAAIAAIADVRDRLPDASHHCWAWRLADGRERADDDGEPRDTAGAPILRHLTGADLVDVVCVVTRYFGGTKLGRGGLIRAYGAAAAAAIDAATIVERPVLASFAIQHGYDLAGIVKSVLSAHDVTVTESAYGADTRLVVQLRVGQADDFRQALTEATAGRVQVRDTAPDLNR